MYLFMYLISAAYYSCSEEAFRYASSRDSLCSPIIYITDIRTEHGESTAWQARRPRFFGARCPRCENVCSCESDVVLMLLIAVLMVLK